MFFLLFLWGVIVVVVNPIGEFQVNDDWSFQRALERLASQGKIESTGWGPNWAPGGPSLIFHLLWGRLFTLFGGWSATTLRISVLVMGVLGSIGMLMLLRRCAGSECFALWGTLTFLLNPLVLSQCFTYMSDVTFAAVTLFSVLFVYVAVRRGGIPFLVVGLVLALCSILTRQLGLVVPAALLGAWALHPGVRPLSTVWMLVLIVSIVLAPWLAYEYFLSWTGGTPLTQHQVLYNVLRHPQAKGFFGYLAFLAANCAIAFAYVGFLISPVLALRLPSYLKWKPFAYFAAALTAACLLFESALLAGLIDPPVGFLRNVIFDFGIGPILLKDTYIMEIQRTIGLPKALFYLLVYWAALFAAVLGCGICESLRHLFTEEEGYRQEPRGFLSTFCLLAALLYLGVIILSGFHDRYLIPVCMWLIVWFVADKPSDKALPVRRLTWIPAAVPLVLMGLFAVIGTHDFMSMKRSLHQAQNYLVADLHVNPCHVDGGFEFNGYRCYRPDFMPKQGLSWWWVEQEDYLLAMGPLPDYSVVRTFPFPRIIGGQAAVYVLKPDEPASAGGH
ncbi:MAG: glycosyltransferase family 39 protein [Desulfomonile tiedjei]|nr:glycosyltransferase family 39 protein [Desulfomonile tiedjei]